MASRVLNSVVLEGKSYSEIKKRLIAIYDDSLSVLLRWRPSKFGLTSFNVVTRRFLMSYI